jgi:hypothetical protein
MTRLSEMEIPFGGHTASSSRIPAENLAERMGNRLIRVRDTLRRIFSSDEEIVIDRSITPQKFEEIRDRVYLDITRNIR